MNPYRIEVPNAHISRLVQEKAFRLGYNWVSNQNVVKLTLEPYLYFTPDGTIIYGRSHAHFRNDNWPEISWNDFLLISEARGYKIRVNYLDTDLALKQNTIRNIQEKLFSLGYRWVGNTLGRRPLMQENVYGYSIRTDMTFAMYMREETFNRSNQIEISLEDLMTSNQSIIINNQINQQNENMEITLTLQSAPKKSKNLTVGKSYVGIFTDANDTQVDSRKDAKYFYCVNDSGNEARYLIGLFAEPAPARPASPPRPARPTFQEILDTIKVYNTSVIYVFNGQNVQIFNEGYSDALNVDEVNCSCGIKSVNGLKDLMTQLRRINFSNVNLRELTGDQQIQLIDAIFKAIVLSTVEHLSAKYFLFSNVTEDEDILQIMDELTEKTGGTSPEPARNPNSGNEIKAWILVSE